MNAQREPLTTTDYLLWGGSTALLVVDWGQTHDLVARGNEEASPFLGRHPTHGAVNRGMLLAVVDNALASRLNDREARCLWWAFFIGLELSMVNSNRVGGIGWRFRF